MHIVSENRSFGGVQGVYRHASDMCNCDMTFGFYLPPAAEEGPVPVLWYLSGLTCTHENAMTKAAAQGWAARAGMAVCFPDTSPRGDNVADDTAYDLGQGAGFYVDATQTPWSSHYRMWSYVTKELPALLDASFPIDPDRQAITGHSMGGHGALTVAIHHPDRFASVSAFAPIAHPVTSDWGRRQFGNYLGGDEGRWAAHDATLLMEDRGFPGPVLVDQGAADQFIELLRPADLARAMAARGQDFTFRMQPGYDHSYFFVQSFMEDHIAFHASALGL
ncbi:S-formylglutathione hydrolase [Meridianimarinicoccus sp. RP-17]|uniref:S-formylglutathione hydrolase n=1 Tax=Meridianimarinicoccus zhengii TaxID=2056810 RepID=UPI000DAEAE08|nr:S-formylglutathione hydrolase [Phycocomes zhengii]